MIPLLACPTCSSAFLQFDRFASRQGAWAALVIVICIAAAPLVLRLLGWRTGAKPLKVKRQKWIPYIAFAGLWIWFLSRMDQFGPAYHRADHSLLFSDVLLYWLFIPFVVLWNGLINPLLFSASALVAGVVGVAWFVVPPWTYAALCNRVDRVLVRHNTTPHA